MQQFFMQILCLTALCLSAWAANSETDFGGVGIDGVPLTNGQILVKQIVSGSPAHQAGIVAGDIITHIDGKATMGANFTDMVQKRLRGLTGSPVVLKIKHDGEEKLQTHRLIRQQLVVVPNKEKK